MHQREVLTVHEGEPNSFNISLQKICAFGFDEQDRSYRPIVMGVDTLLLEDEKALCRLLLEFTIRELESLFLWLSIGADNEYLLIQFFNTLFI